MEKIVTQGLFRIWAVVGLLAVVILWFLPWRFQTNDDVLMMWLVSGAYTGTPESYAVFIHPLLSWLFSKLYTISPVIKWYPLLWFLVMFWSYVGLLKVLFQSQAGLAGRMIFATILLFLLIHFSFFLQFTIVSGFAALAGFSLMGSRNKNWSFRSGLLIFSLLLISMLIRWESFVLVGLGYFAYLLVFRLSLLKSEFLLLAAVGLLGLIGFLSKSAWEKSSEFSAFVSYNQARAAVSDHPVTYRLISDQKIPNDSKWFYFSQWMMDEDQISIEELQERKAVLDAGFLSFNQLSSSFSHLGKVLKAEAFKSIFSLIVLVCYFFSGYELKQKLLFFLSWMLFFLVFNHFFILNGRVVILFIFPFLIAAILAPFASSKTFALSAILILTALIGIHLSNSLREAEGRKIMREEFLVLRRTIPDSALTFLEGYKENYLQIDYSLNQPVSFLSFGWISKSPFQQKALKRFGLSSIRNSESFYLMGVDVYEEFFFAGYMNFISPEDYRLEQEVESDNWILFHYVKPLEKKGFD